MTSKFLLILGIGHVLGNFYFQTDKISEEKDKSFKGVIIHAIEYTLSVFLVMLPFINMGLIKWGLLYSVSHFAIDAIGSITKLVGFGIPDIAPPAHV